MDDTIEELAELTGGKREKVTLQNGKTLTLAPLVLNDLVEIQQRFPGAEDSQSLAALRFQIWLSAKRAGCDLSEEELGDMLTPADIVAVNDALSKLLGEADDSSGKARQGVGRLSSG